MNRSKERCEQLRNIRKRVAERYGLDYTPTECNHEGPCAGTCPLCDAEAQDIERQLAERDIEAIDPFEPIEDMGIEPIEIDDTIITMGIPSHPFIFDVKERKLYKECPIAGITFHNLENIWDELYEGARLALVRQKHNKHDKNAIAVALANDYDGNPNTFDFSLILGYVPRTENEHLAAMMDLGWEDAFECEISQVNGTNPFKGSLYMKIYMVSREDKDTSDSELLRILEVNKETFDTLESNFLSMGLTYFRWGGFPPWLRDLPIRGDKIVIMLRDKNYSHLYLMHCLAAGDDEASKYIDDDRLNCSCDDCCFYVFSNIKGPIKVENHELNFLKAEKINLHNPEDFISSAATLQIKRLFDL